MTSRFTRPGRWKIPVPIWRSIQSGSAICLPGTGHRRMAPDRCPGTRRGHDLAAPFPFYTGRHLPGIVRAGLEVPRPLCGGCTIAAGKGHTMTFPPCPPIHPGNCRYRTKTVINGSFSLSLLRYSYKLPILLKHCSRCQYLFSVLLSSGI